MISALVLSILYFALMTLLMIDSSRALGEANKFRAYVIASTMAESGAELAGQQMVSRDNRTVREEDIQGIITGQMTRTPNCEGCGESEYGFEIIGDATSIGAITQKSHVRLQGRVKGSVVTIDYCTHQ